MRVILSAFQRKLKSDVMDFPEGTGHHIDLLLDMREPDLFGQESPTPQSIIRRATFEWKGIEQFDDRPDPIREFVLVDVI